MPARLAVRRYLPLGEKGEGANAIRMRQDLPRFLKRIGFPKAHGAIHAGGREELSIRRERNPAHRLVVSRAGLDFHFRVARSHIQDRAIAGFPVEYSFFPSGEKTMEERPPGDPCKVNAAVPLPRSQSMISPGFWDLLNSADQIPEQLASIFASGE